MRLWSIDPVYLDPVWLIALWREWLLAKKVLEWKTKWYINHPQLIRFKNTNNATILINNYLYFVFLEAKNRWYNFDLNKIKHYPDFTIRIKITIWQINFEFNHLQNKLKIRNFDKYKENLQIKNIKTNWLFEIDFSNENIELWEKLKF